MIPAAIETFARGFSFTRSFTHPYLPEQFERAWVVRDAPRKNPADYRNEEWIAHNVPPKELDALARKNARGRFSICAICPSNQSDAPLRTAYKTLGYRLITTEPLMLHTLALIPQFHSPAQIHRVTAKQLADKLNKTARSRQILPQHFADDSPLRQYAAEIDNQIVGWVRSITAGDSTWCSNMHVLPAFRRRGIAKSLLSQMLRDDRAHGAKSAVLLASHTGALLYPAVGYRQIGNAFDVQVEAVIAAARPKVRG